MSRRTPKENPMFKDALSGAPVKPAPMKPGKAKPKGKAKAKPSAAGLMAAFGKAIKK